MEIVLILFALVLVAASIPVGAYMRYALDGATSFLNRFDRWIVRIGGSAAIEDQNWKQYSIALLIFNACMFVVVGLVLWFQGALPLNPDGKGGIEFSLVFNTAASFVTNTNLQHYSGEVTMSYFSQLFGLMWLQFVSAGTGIAALAALARGLSGKRVLGNYYRDLARSVLLILLPAAALLSIALLLTGVPMTFDGAMIVRTMEGTAQTISRGPVAAFVAIKQLGTNGGGFFGPNSAHPFENTGFLSNLIESSAILILPMACVWMFGWITGRKRHAAVIFGVMSFLLVIKVVVALNFEQAPNAAFAGLPVQPHTGNLEGKELRFSSPAGPVWAALTTATSNGSVNSMHGSLNPLTLLVPFAGMWLNVVFGGVGVGIINMFLYIIIGVFICGLMIGRTPEYLTRKVETREMKLALLAMLLHPALILVGTTLFAATPLGAGTTLNPGARGFMEILYEFTSAAANNGSGLEGLGDNTVAWNIATGIVMLLARYIPIILPLAIAGLLAEKKPTPETNGTFHTDTPMFGIVVLGSIVFIGALLFLPVAVLGPVAEHLSLLQH